MGWPIESDYFEAVQNPRLAFNDSELKSGNVTVTKLGLPKPITGAFASVYQMNCGSSKWAVRCFLRDFADQQRRYEAISNHLNQSRLSYTVGFEFQREGIRIRGQWFPILKMEWIDGEPLNTYVANNLGQPSVLHQLARDWVSMIGALRQSGIAHGDLQHGNIIVSRSKLRLIDYDGMYVPALKGMVSHEEGHRNFQHPARTSRDFNVDIDNFSAWVVFLSITSLTIDPRLWKLLNGGDECLLLRREDFQRPNQSKALQALERSGRPELEAFASRLRSMLQMPLQQVPSLDVASTQIPQIATSLPQGAGVTSGASWLADHLPASPKVVEGLFDRDKETPQGPPPSTASWIMDHLASADPITPPFARHSFLPDRLLVVSAVCLWLLAALVALSNPFVSVVLATCAIVESTLTIVLLRVRFSRLPAVAERRGFEHRIAGCRKASAEVNKALSELAGRRRTLLAPLTKLDEEYRRLPETLKAKHEEVVRAYNQSVASLDRERAEFDSREAAELKAIEARVSAEISRLTQQRAQIDQSEQAELQQLGTSIRRNHVAYALQNARVSSASISGFGVKMKAILQAHGITTAADIDNRIYHISGIGPSKAATLLAWRHSVESYAQSTSPSPTGSDVSALRSRFSAARQPITQRLNGFQASLHRDRQTVLERYAQLRQTFTRRLEAAKRQLDRDTVEATAISDRRRAELKLQFDRSKKTIDRDESLLRQEETTFQQQLFQRKFELSKLHRDADRYKSVTFGQYLKCTIRIRRAA